MVQKNNFKMFYPRKIEKLKIQIFKFFGALTVSVPFLNLFGEKIRRCQKRTKIDKRKKWAIGLCGNGEEKVRMTPDQVHRENLKQLIRLQDTCQPDHPWMIFQGQLLIFFIQRKNSEFTFVIYLDNI